MTRRIPPLLLLAALAGCAHHHEVAELAPPPAPVAVEAPPRPAALSAINSNLSEAATVWHLRAGLNVAALACRGPESGAIVARYNALLTTRKAELAAAETALAAEYRAGGGKWQDRYDDAMTRLYNFFSSSPARERFCAAAATVLAETETLTPGALPAFAAERLPAVDAPFAPASPPAPAPVLAYAVAGKGRSPRLQLDMATLSAR